MSVDREKELPSRREMVRLGAAALAGAGMSLLAPPSAYAGSTDPLLLGEINSAGNPTILKSSSDSRVFELDSDGDGSPTGSPTGSHLRFKSLVVGSPTTGSHETGDLFCDLLGVHYRCVANGTPGTWTRVTSTILLDAPVRVLDTRTGHGGLHTPLASGIVCVVPYFVRPAGIPDQALGIVGNLTMITSTGRALKNSAWAAIVPAKLSSGIRAPEGYPGVYSLCVPAATSAATNQFTVALHKHGSSITNNRVSIVTASGTVKLHPVIDVVAYII